MWRELMAEETAPVTSGSMRSGGASPPASGPLRSRSARIAIRRLLRTLPLLLSLAPSGCSSPLAADLSSYEEGLRRWEAAGIDAYSFRYELRCFCGGPGIRPAEIEVRDGSVVAVRFPDGEPPEPYNLEAYPTVPALFQEVRSALERKPFAVRAEYDGALGYPKEFFADFLENAIDEEFGFRAWGLVAAD